jgi:hypothetical protein
VLASCGLVHTWKSWFGLARPAQRVVFAKGHAACEARTAGLETTQKASSTSFLFTFYFLVFVFCQFSQNKKGVKKWTIFTNVLITCGQHKEWRSFTVNSPDESNKQTARPTKSTTRGILIQLFTSVLGWSIPLCCPM